MASQRRPLVVVLIIGGSLAAGLLTVYLGGKPSQETIAIAPSFERNETVLIIGVDDLGAPEPRLVSVWQATYSAQNGDLLLQGSPTDGLVCGAQAVPMQHLFQWSPESGVSPEFLESFGDMPYVVVDESGFGALIDELEGFELNGAHLSGAQVIAVLRTLYGNPPGSLATQEQFVIALSSRAAAGIEGVDLNRLLELIPDHAYTSVAPQELLTTYLRLQPLKPGSILVWAPNDGPYSCDD